MLSLKKYSTFLLASLVFLFLFIFLKQLSHWYENKLQTQATQMLKGDLERYSSSITQSIQRRLILMNLLKEHVKVQWEKKGVFDPHNPELIRFVQSLYQSTRGIRVLQVSPAGIHTFVYPLKGNEKTLGRNLFDDPRPRVKLMLDAAMKTKQITLNAPYQLRQGGFGLVSRVAIYQNDLFWGFVVMVLDMNIILQEAQYTQANKRLYLAISQNDKIIYGDPKIQNKKYVQVQLQIQNQNLTLLAANKSSLQSSITLLIKAGILIISLLSAFITFILLRRQEKLEKSVQQTLDELEQRNQELNLVIQKAPNPIMLFNEEGEVLIVNEVWEKLTGYKHEEINTIDKWVNLAFEEKAQNTKAHILSLFNLTQSIEEGEFVIQTKNQQRRVWNFYSTPFGKIQGKHTVITSAVDITELKEKDHILLQQSKMASLGEMLENIAHQWRQPLSIISTASTGILFAKENDMLKDDILEDSMKAISDSVQYLSKTIDYFRLFLSQKAEKDMYFMDKILTKALTLVHSKFKNRQIQVIQDIEPIKFYCVENDLLQVFINILNNARDALENISSDRYIFVRIYKKEHQVFVEIKDNAGGIPENIINKIFEPYFTTKEQSKGTGIGLFMSQKIIVKNLKGEMKVHTEEYSYLNENYKGAVFTLCLPILKQ